MASNNTSPGIFKRHKVFALIFSFLFLAILAGSVAVVQQQQTLNSRAGGSWGGNPVAECSAVCKKLKGRKNCEAVKTLKNRNACLWLSTQNSCVPFTGHCSDDGGLKPSSVPTGKSKTPAKTTKPDAKDSETGSGEKGKGMTCTKTSACQPGLKCMNVCQGQNCTDRCWDDVATAAGKSGGGQSAPDAKSDGGGATGDGRSGDNLKSCSIDCSKLSKNQCKSPKNRNGIPVCYITSGGDCWADPQFFDSGHTAKYKAISCGVDSGSGGETCNVDCGKFNKDNCSKTKDTNGKSVCYVTSAGNCFADTTYWSGNGHTAKYQCKEAPVAKAPDPAAPAPDPAAPAAKDSGSGGASGGGGTTSGGGTGGSAPAAAPDAKAPTTAPAAPGASTGSVTLKLYLKFQGITKKPTNTTPLKVKVSLSSSVSQTADFTSDENGGFTGSVTFSKVDLSKKYSIYVKGPKHIQKRVCDATPTETRGGTYSCSTDNVTLKSGENGLNFDKILLLAGDLPEQDGVVDSSDVSFIRQNLTSQDSDALAIGDVNLNGIVDTQDYALVIAALSIKTDDAIK